MKNWVIGGINVQKKSLKGPNEIFWVIFESFKSEKKISEFQLPIWLIDTSK